MLTRYAPILLIGLLTLGIAGGAAAGDGTLPARAHYCLDTAAVQGDDTSSPASGAGVSLHGLLATMGIGLLSLLFLMPIAWFCELLMHRGKPADKSEPIARVG